MYVYVYVGIQVEVENSVGWTYHVGSDPPRRNKKCDLSLACSSSSTLTEKFTAVLEAKQDMGIYALMGAVPVEMATKVGIGDVRVCGRGRWGLWCWLSGGH